MGNQTLSFEGIGTLDACVIIEETCGRVYRALAALFSDNQAMATLWQDMAAEEDAHAEEFRAAAQRHGRAPYDGANYLIEGILQNITRLQQKIVSTPPALRDALLTTIILEESIEKYHLDVSRLVNDPALTELLTRMVGNSRGHAELLKQAHAETDS